MAIDPQLLAWYARLAGEFGTIARPDEKGRRERYLAISTLLREPDPVGVTQRFLRLALPGRTIGADLYHPGGDRPPPLMIFAHGGGWVVGSAATHRDLGMRIAAQSGVAVLNVDYRLAPEHPFPAPCDDVYDALCWAAAQADELAIDARRIAVGGDSAGAHLAAGAAVTARDRGGPELAFQWLLYPTVEPVFDNRSNREFGAGPGLTTDDMRYFWQQFLPGGLELDDPRAVPSRAESLSDLAPALVLVAGHDPLRDEGERHATRLDEAGVRVQLVRAADMTHGFARLGVVCDEARRELDLALVALRDAMA